MVSKVDKLLKKSRKGQLSLVDLGAELEKFSTDELEDFIEGMQGESIILENKAEKVILDLEKAKDREVKLSTKRQKITDQLDKIPPEPNIIGPSGEVAVRGHRYYANEHMLEEKDYNILERYSAIENKLRMYKERVDHLDRHQQYFHNVIKVAESIKTGDHSFLDNVRKEEAQRQEDIKNWSSDIFGPLKENKYSK